MNRIKRILSSLLIASMLTGTGAPMALAQETAPETTETQTTSEPAPTGTTSEPTTAEPSTTSGTEPGTTTTQTGPTSEPTGPTTEPTAPSAEDPKGPIPRWAFDESTKKWVATRQDTFYWDSTAQRWKSPYYFYKSTNGWWYVQQNPTPVSATSTGGAGAAGTADYGSAAAALAALLGLADPVNSNTGPNSTNTATLNNNQSALFNILFNATVNNSLDSTATTGNATVSGNTTGGSATTGMATTLANFFNLINSAWSWATGDLSYFVGNFFGDHTGDLTLSPTTSSGGGGSMGCFFCFGGSINANRDTGADSTNTATTNNNQDLTVNYQPSGTINNDLNLLSQTGDASVTGNTTGGNATSGDAVVELNLINMINSAIGSGGSFFGLLNIFGNLNGDILFPAGFLDGLLGSAGGTSGGTNLLSNTNTGPESTNTAAYNNNASATITDGTQAAFNNNIDSAALSGNALVDTNTTGGNATSGDATTNTNTYNLFNSGVTGDNAVLVLVNVLGTWVGMIMELPTYGGSSSALLGGNAVLENNNTGPGSTNTASYNDNSNLDINYSPTGTINNNINAGAISGNASVTGNTTGGNATSGDAMVAANVVNIMGSNLNLRNWFGVLVINVFGDWFGSVGVDTEAGEPDVSALGKGGSGAELAFGTSGGSQPASSGSFLGSTGGTGGSGQLASAVADDIRSAIATTGTANDAQMAAAKDSAAKTSTLLLLMAGLILGAGALAALERKLRLG